MHRITDAGTHPEPLSDFDSNSHFINLNYDGFLPYAELRIYAYLLDFDNSPGNSTASFGSLGQGSYPITEKVEALYALEYAHQTDHGDNPNDVDAEYVLGEAGASIALGGFIDSVTLKFSYELLTGEGVRADGNLDRLLTPLGTNHAFQGWADRFLVTPADGIQDFYGSFIANVYGAKFMAVYHHLESDNDSYDYGDEIDLLLTKTFKEHYTLGLKCAHYDADGNATNLARNPTQSADTTKFWVFAQIKF